MNIVTIDRIIELSESKTKFEKLRKILSNWKALVIISITALTLKVMAEQLVMILIRLK